jgi:hypothetical protein
VQLFSISIPTAKKPRFRNIASQKIRLANARRTIFSTT